MPLEQGMKPSVDTVTRSALGAIESDGRLWTPRVGTWSADGTKLTTTTARTSDPRITVMEPYTDFDIKADQGYGDAIYLRYKDESNWLRVTQHQATSSTPYACNPYACNPVACNPYACNPYSCNPYACNGYACNPYACNGYACNPVSCNCTNTYTTANNYQSSNTCLKSGSSAIYVYCNQCNGTNTCCYNSCASLGSGWYSNGTGCAASGYCSLYSGQSCQTCYSTCYQTCYQTCYSTCYSTCYGTCYQTCYSTCYDTCYNYFYPVYLRLEKFVAGTLTLIQELGLGENARANWVRVTGKGNAINVYSDRSPTTAHITQTVNENIYANGYGVGRHGYGNQDSGAVLDNITIKPFGQP